MGEKVKATKLTKTEHVYVLQAAGRQWRVKLHDDGSLLLETGGPMVSIVGYGSAVSLRQEEGPVRRQA